MLRYRKYSKRQYIAIFIGLVLLFFFDDLLIIILVKQFGYLPTNRLLSSIIVIWLFLVSVGLAYAVISIKREKPTTGSEGLLENMGKVIETGNNDYRISIHGEIWKAESTVKLAVGDRVQVTAINGLTLQVEKII